MWKKYMKWVSEAEYLHIVVKQARTTTPNNFNELNLAALNVKELNAQTNCLANNRLPLPLPVSDYFWFSINP